MPLDFLRDSYPNFVIECPTKLSRKWPSDILSSVKEQAEYFKFDDRRYFKPSVTEFFRDLAEIQYDDAIAKHNLFKTYEYPELDRQRHLVIAEMFESVGRSLYENLKPGLAKKYDYTFSFGVLASRDHILVKLKRLESVLVENRNWAYRSPYRPKVRFNGSDYSVLMSAHALDRIFIRLSLDGERSHLGIQTYLNVVHDVIEYDTVVLPDEQPACRISLSAAPGLVGYYFANAVMPERDPMKNWAFVVGYLPISLVGEYAYCATCLLPGYNNTPERAALLRKYPNDARVRNLQPSDYCLRTMITNDDFTFPRMMHEAGVPQVYECDKVLMAAPNAGLLSKPEENRYDVVRHATQKYRK